ncbi:hypothetical protein ACFE04_004800 [Oxalis oulophora]
MGTFEIEAQQDPTKIMNGEEDEDSPIEQVRLTVPNTDDTTLPVWTFRMWFLGILSCALLSFLNTFFSYRKEPLIITQITIQVATLPIGRFMASVLPKKKYKIGSGEYSLNPGPFNMKEHALISIFANAGSAFGNGPAYAVGIVDIIKAFYGRKISFLASWVLIITTQVLGYGWAGLLRKYVVEPAHMWWPSTLVQISLFRTLHEEEENDKDKEYKMSRIKFFFIALVCSFCWYLFPGYLFQTLQSIAWVCWAFPNSVTAHQVGSGLSGLGLGAFTLDWTTVASFLFSPLVSPFFVIVNVFMGYAVIIYIVIPICYWGLNIYSAQTFPLFSSDLFTAQGESYDIRSIVNKDFKLDLLAYAQTGKVHLSMFFAVTYGFSFAAIASTLTHVALFYGKEIKERFQASSKGKEDNHTKMMKKYDDIPSWWFYVLLVVTILVSLLMCIVFKKEIQMPWWGLLFAAALAFVFTLPISIITATTNQTPGLNIITEYIMGAIKPGEPITNVCFKTYGYMSMTQAISFLSDFKLGHYMKIPPKSMFLVQFSSMHRLFGAWSDPNESSAHKDYTLDLTVLFGATAYMPPATALNYNSWILVGTVFNYFIFRYRKKWWQRYNYILSAALDAGVAFMAVVLYFTLGLPEVNLNWWGNNDPEHCRLANCPTARGIIVDGCPNREAGYCPNVGSLLDNHQPL